MSYILVDNLNMLSDLNFLDDQTKNDLLKQNFSNNLLGVRSLRLSRANAALLNYLNTAGYSQYPKLTLIEIDNQLAELQNIYNTSPSDQLLNSIQRLQNLKNTNDYCVENSPEYTYRENRKNFAKTFMWPDANELTIREQEKQQLLALLGQ